MMRGIFYLSLSLLCLIASTVSSAPKSGNKPILGFAYLNQTNKTEVIQWMLRKQCQIEEWNNSDNKYLEPEYVNGTKCSIPQLPSLKKISFGFKDGVLSEVNLTATGNHEQYENSLRRYGKPQEVNKLPDGYQKKWRKNGIDISYSFTIEDEFHPELPPALFRQTVLISYITYSLAKDNDAKQRAKVRNYKKQQEKIDSLL